MNAHLGDDAALYALGALEANELRAADEHLATCEACCRLVARASDDVTMLEAARVEGVHDAAPARVIPLRPRMRAPRWIAAAAAVVILAFAPAGYFAYQNAQMHAAMIADADAMTRIATAPHRVASFDGSMDAKVMYGSDGSWYVVVIRGAKAGLNIVWPHDGTQTLLGPAVQHGNVAVLYLPKSHRMDRLTIVNDGHVVGQAQLVF
jgi:anti-sigma factor RsiW